MKIPKCHSCPRNCGVPREGPQGAGRCKSGAEIRVARAALHHWEEPPISGSKGSGTVFFVGCPLGCIYCQNYEISGGAPLGKIFSPKELNELFFSLVGQGAHNINLVTPTHFAPMLYEALSYRKLPVPVIYNTSGYEAVETLKILEGLVDIYLPDFKYAEPELAGKLSHAPDYPQIVLPAIEEMARQAGPPVLENGLMKKGVLIRHLLLPGHTKNAIAVLRTIKERFPHIPVSLMAQYTPCGNTAGFPELCRPVTKRELEKVQEELFALGLTGFVQSRSAKGAQYIPNFHQFDRPGPAGLS